MARTTGTRLSAWEMLTHGQSVFRVLGAPFGVSETAAKILFWAQAVHGGAIEFTAEQHELFTAHAGNGFILEHKSMVSAVLDAQSQTAFCAAPAALDLSCAMAHEAGTGLSVLNHIHGAQYCGWIAEHACERGFACLVSYTTNSGISGGYLALPGDPAACFHWTAETPANVHLRLIETARSAGSQDTICRALLPNAALDRSPGALIADLVPRLITPDSTEPCGSGSVICLCIDCSDRQTTGKLSEQASGLTVHHRNLTNIDLTTVHQDALTQGVWVEDRAAQTFLELARKLWLPTSPRSRLQGSDAADPSP